MGIALLDMVLASTIDDLWVSIFPFFAGPTGYRFEVILESQEILDSLVGAWVVPGFVYRIRHI